MRNVIYSIMVSLDGYIESPTHDLNWVIIDEELHRYINDQQRKIGAYLYGRRMYEIMANFWPTADEDPAALPYIAEYSRIWKNMPKIVFSKTLERVEGNSRLIRDNIADEVKKLKEQPGKGLSIGGAGIASTFMQLGLIDEYELYLQPVILGGGTRMFPLLDASISLKFIETRTFGSGVVYLHYQSAAPNSSPGK
jgi:dihydrofolate reductase